MQFKNYLQMFFFQEKKDTHDVSVKKIQEELLKQKVRIH